MILYTASGPMSHLETPQTRARDCRWMLRLGLGLDILVAMLVIIGVSCALDAVVVPALLDSLVTMVLGTFTIALGTTGRHRALGAIVAGAPPLLLTGCLFALGSH